MKMKQRKTVKNKNTRGMALLFTLGVLMMVLVVVMLYASKVKTEAKLASSQLENQSAKLLAQSLLPRVMITLNKSQTAQDLHIYSSDFLCFFKKCFRDVFKFHSAACFKPYHIAGFCGFSEFFGKFFLAFKMESGCFHSVDPGAGGNKS